jgi:GT2 family glycosyltransferase
VDVAGVIQPPSGWLDDPRRPPVVIAIPNWNRRDLLEECVESLLRFTAYPRFRICVFDQGSTDGSREQLLAWGARVDAMLAPENVGFILANNAIIDRYPGWDVLLLNNDTRVGQADWLDVLVTTAYSGDDIGLVGAKLVYPDGRLQEAGSQLFRNGSARAYGKFEDLANPAFNVRRDVDFSSAACLYVKRAVLDRCGAFEECFCPCYYEDVDLALKARAAGYRTVFEPRVIVVHNEYGTSGKTSATAFMVRNQEILVRRWREVLERLPLSLWQLPAGNGRAQVLVLGTATDGTTARAQRLLLIIETLARDYDVAYAHMAAVTADQRLRVPQSWAVTVFYPGFARAVGSDVLDLGAILLHNQFRWVVFDAPETANEWAGLVREYGKGVLIGVDVALDEPFGDPTCPPVDALLSASTTHKDAVQQACPRVTVGVLPGPALASSQPTQTSMGRLFRMMRRRPRRMTPGGALDPIEQELGLRPRLATK